MMLLFIMQATLFRQFVSEHTARLIISTASLITIVNRYGYPGLHQKSQTRSQTVVSHDLKFPTSNQHLDARFDVGLTSIRRLRFQTRVVQSAVSVIVR